MISDILTSIIGGAILGILARLFLPGKQNISMLVTIIAGIVAAFVGTLIARLFGFNDTSGVDWWKFFVQLVLALFAVSFAAKTFPKKDHRHDADPAAPPGPSM